MKQLRELYEYREMISVLSKKIYAADIKALYWDFCGHLSIRYYSLSCLPLCFRLS